MADVVTIQTSRGPFTVSRSHADRFKSFLDDPEWGDYQFDPKQSGGYNPRNIAGTNTPSQHSFGNAIDINWTRNARGTAGDINPELARRLAQKHGLRWGGDWSNPDPMHFEVVSGAAAPPLAQRGITAFAGLTGLGSKAASQPPDGMDAATYGKASPQPMALGGPKPGYPMSPYTGMTPEEVELKRRLALRQLQEGSDSSPVGHWTQALSRAIQGGLGGYGMTQASLGERSGQQSASQSLAAALQGGNRQAAISGMLSNPWTRDMGSKLALSEFASNSPGAQLERQIKEAQLKAAQRKEAPTFGKIGRDEFGEDQYGWIDPSTQTVKPANPGAAPGVPGAPPLSLPTGEEYLKTLPQPVADQVRGISEGRIAFPSGFALSKPYWKKMVQHVSQYDPNFDAVNYNARNKTRSDFTSGKSAQNITAFNTAIQHLDTLHKSVDGLENSNVPLWNKVANAARIASGDAKFAEAVKKFETARTAVADELTRAFRGMGGNVHDIMQWEKNINGADSPGALRGAIKQAIELLDGRLEAVADQYNRGMGTTKKPLELLSPKAQEAVKRMHGGERVASGASPPAAAGSPPPGRYVWNPKTGKPEPVGQAAEAPGAVQPEATAPSEIGSKDNPFPTYKDAQRGKFFMHQGIKLYLDPNLGPVRAPE